MSDKHEWTDGKPFEYEWRFLGRRYRAVETQPGIVSYFATEVDSDHARYTPVDHPLGLTNELVHLAAKVRELEAETCDGSGYRPCSNPDHGFITALGTVGGLRSPSEAQCPACGYSGRERCDGCPNCYRARAETAESRAVELERIIVNASRYQPMYNGRPSCPFCWNFVDDEETHQDSCIVVEIEKREEET